MSNMIKNEKTIAEWLHRFAQFEGRKVSATEIVDETGIALGSIGANLITLKIYGDLEVTKIGHRPVLMSIQITDKGRELMGKYPPAVYVPKPQSHRQRLDGLRLRDDSDAAAVLPSDRFADAARPQFSKASFNELAHLDMFVCGTLDLVSHFGPALETSSLQMRTAYRIFRSALENERQSIQLAMDEARKRG